LGDPQKPKGFSQIFKFPQNPKELPQFMESSNPKEFSQIYGILKIQGIHPIFKFPKNLRNSLKF